MLREEFNSEKPAPRSPPARRTPAIKVMLVLAVLAVLFMRNDFWQWDTPGYLLFGFLPQGLWWQGLVSLCAAGMMWLMVHFAWPGELEDEAIEAEAKRLALQQSQDAHPASPAVSKHQDA